MKKLLIPIALFLSGSLFSQLSVNTPLTGGPFTTFSGTIGINVATAMQSGYVSTVGQEFKGNKTFKDDVLGISFQNRNDFRNATLNLTNDGAVIIRDIGEEDDGTALTVNQKNADSEGTIFEAQFQGTTMFQVNYTGSTVVNKTDPSDVHALKVGQNNGSGNPGDILVLAADNTNVVVYNKMGQMNLYSGASATNGQIPIGNSTGTSAGAWTMGTITPAVGTTVTNGVGSITVSSGYTLQGFMSKFDPGTTAKYGGGAPGVVSTTSAGTFKVFIPVSGTLDKIYLFGQVGSLGSTGATGEFYVTIDDVTDVTISTSVPLDVSTFEANVTNVNTAVTAGHFFEIKVVKPGGYAMTPPTNVNCNVVLWIK